MQEKFYDAAIVEREIAQKWRDLGHQACNPRSEKLPFTLVMPPPNVTGSLHLGHALTFTLQDILVRYWRMRGRDVLWQPGTDHAGIATQILVENQLEQEGLARQSLGREAFLERAWRWTGCSQGNILGQLKLLGASADWERTRFTLDPDISETVQGVFVTLYEAGLIYKDYRLVNWDPHLQTAISDLEVDNREIKTHLYFIDYPLEKGPVPFITVATTRPETLFGDQAVAVHAQDHRYQALLGHHVRLPLTNRLIPIIADSHCDPTKGTGAVKITPAHDFNDFNVGQRHQLKPLNILDSRACLNENVPGPFQGLPRFQARKKVLESLSSLGLLRHQEDIATSVPHGDRSGVIIEPWLTEQWYVNASVLAKPALKAVHQGRIRFFPSFWKATYDTWLNNIQPWCISRQLWWGHRIPAWYGPDQKVFVASCVEQAQRQAQDYYGEDVPLVQDESVLDTWFSSALWPLTTLGWPKKTQDMSRYYPTDVLMTGFDIIFFWVARMIMMGLYLQKEVPFRTVYIHALIRDEKGQKMSKSKGNVVDPLEVINHYGADALRWTLALLSTPGRDIRFATSHVQGARNFITKLWNAVRFCLLKGCVLDRSFDPSVDPVHGPLNRWLIGELVQLEPLVVSGVEGFLFHEAAQKLYQFVWGVYCDWYLEIAKVDLEQESGPLAQETKKVAAWVLARLLHLLHPITPFVTEELWCRLGCSGLLMNAPPLSRIGFKVCAESHKEVEWIIQWITQVRALRGVLKVPASASLRGSLFLTGHSAAARLQAVKKWIPCLLRLLRLREIHCTTDTARPQKSEGCVQVFLEEGIFVLDLQGVVDLVAQRQRLEKALDKQQRVIQELDSRLSDSQFQCNAPASVVEKLKERLHVAQDDCDKLRQDQQRLAVATAQSATCED